jgi:DNA modification methylase
LVSERGVPVDDSGHTNGAVAGSVPWEGVTRNKRSVWTVATQPFKEAHFATFPPALVEPCILAGCPRDGVVLDPFGGAGTTGLVADRLQRNAILIELNPEYSAIAERRICGDAPLLAQVTPAA